MQALRLRIKGSFNSFRLAQEMRYQTTYFYPPKTTLIGLVGAALGFEDKKLEKVYDKTFVGIILDRLDGQAKDLWRIVKPKRTEEEKTVVIREMLYNPVYWFYFSFVSKDDLEKLKEAFRDPFYPLTLGRSDELIFIDSLDVVDLRKADKDACYRWTVLPFDYRDKNFKFEGVSFSKPFSVPQVFKIPTGFEYKKGGRVPKDERFFTHIFDVGLKFEDNVGWKDSERYFFMF